MSGNFINYHQLLKGSLSVSVDFGLHQSPGTEPADMSFNGQGGRVPKTEIGANSSSQGQKSDQNAGGNQLPLPRDEEKMPLFLIKLWNIVEDPSLQQIIKWDESGTSFHITDPYSFCRNVLPHYFKHNNINSLIRQLNMYGFRKMTPLNQGGLTRTESDQDHLEFSHPYFVRDHPDLLVNIKRKQSARSVEPNMSTQTQANLELVVNEIRSLRDKQKNMDNRMHQLINENKNLHNEVSTMKQQHNRQQAIVKKLVQFLIVMVQPRLTTNRMVKKGVLAIDEPPTKKPRSSGPGAGAAANPNNLSELLDRLERELINNADFRRAGPIIADVTDEVDPSPLIEEQQNEAYSPSNYQNNLQEQQEVHINSPTIVTQPSPVMPQNQMGNQRQYATRYASRQSPANSNSGGVRYTSNLQRGGAVPQPQVQQQQPMQSPHGQMSGIRQGILNDNGIQSGNGSTELEQYMAPQTTSTNRQQMNVASSSAQLSPQEFPQAFSPTIAMSPSLDRQISQELQMSARNPFEGNLGTSRHPTAAVAPLQQRHEQFASILMSQDAAESAQIPQTIDTLEMMPTTLQDYFNGVDLGIDSCRDLLTNTDWNFDFNDELTNSDPRQVYGQQLALEGGPNQAQIQQQMVGGQQHTDGAHDYVIDQASSPLVQAISPGATSSGAASVENIGTGGQSYNMGGAQRLDLEGLEPLFDDEQFLMTTPDPLGQHMAYSPPTHTNSSGPLIPNQINQQSQGRQNMPSQTLPPQQSPQPASTYRRQSGRR